MLASQPGEIDDDDLALPEDELDAVEDSPVEPASSDDDLADEVDEVQEDEVAAEA